MADHGRREASDRFSWELVVVDPSVEAWQTLTRELTPNAKLLILDPAQDGVNAIKCAVAHLHKLSAIHVIAHGHEAEVRLGSTFLSSANLAEYSGALKDIGRALSGGDILLYGCEVARGAAGRHFVDGLARITGANVAAATHPVGAAALGGSWELDFSIGPVGAHSAFGPGAMSAFPGLLQQYFDDNSTIANGAIDGGSGIWNNASTNWTNSAGTANAVYDPTSATVTVFGSSGVSTPATGGIVTVDAGGILLTSNVQFRATGDNSIYTIGGGGLTLAAGGTTFDVIDVTGSPATDAVINSIIIGAGLTKSGGGTLTLGGANAYSGSTTVNGGMLALSGAGTLGAAANSTTVFNATLDLGGTTQTQNGGVKLTFGTIQNGTLSSSGTYDLNGGSVSAVLAGTGSVLATDFNVTLSGANTYTGITNITTGGTLTISGAGTLGAATGSVSVSGISANLDLGGTTQTKNGGVLVQNNGSIDNGTLSSSGTFSLLSGSVSAILAGTGALSKFTGGSVTLSGANTHSGGTTVSGGTLNLSGAGTLGAITNSLLVNPATLDLGGTTQTQNGGVTLQSGTIQDGTLSSSGTFALSAGTVSAILAGTGTVDKTTGATVTLSGGNTYSGVTTIAEGVLALSGLGGVANSSQVNLSNAAGTFDISATTLGTTITTLNGVANSHVELGSKTLTVSDGSTTYAGVIQGTGGLTLTGGTETLTGTNTYIGATTINGGTLLVHGSIVSTTTVGGTGTLGGNGTTGAVNVAGGGTLAPGASVGDIDTGNLTFLGGSNLSIELGGTTAGSQYDQVRVTGTVSLGGATLTGSLINGFNPETATGATFRIIENDGTDLVAGTFAGLAEGATFSFGGSLFSISYVAGTGNDVVLTALNDSPVLNANTGTAVNEGASTTILNAQLDFNDPDNTDSQIAYTVTSLTANGTLFRNAVALGIGSTFTQADILGNLLTYTHNGGETASDSFGFSVTDGIAPAITGQTFAITVTPQNDPPVITSNGGGATANINLLENAAAVTTVTATDPDGPSLAFLIAGGDDAGKFQINASTGALSFITAPNFDVRADADHNNSFIVQVRASDGTLFDEQLITVQVTDDPNVTSTVHWTQSVIITPHPFGWLPAGNGDFNGDGATDLAWFNATTGNIDIWKLSNGAWAGSSNVGNHPAGYQPVGFGDYNGDGTDDILWFNPTTRDIDLWKIVDGGWAGSVSIGTHPAGWTPALTGDFNGDGTSDIAWHNPATNAIDIWKIVNGQWAGSVDNGAHPGGYQPALAGDFNGDGTDDIAWYNPTTGDVDIWKMSNGQWAGSVTAGPHPLGWLPLGAADFNLDGTDDIAWQNPTTRNIDIWLLQNGQWSQSMNVGVNPGPVVAVGVGDFDNNGVNDIMWRDTITGHIDNWMLAFS